MAEVAIPIAVLGAMYIISNKNENKRENYSNIKQSLANTKPIVKNFPKKTFDDLLNQTNQELLWKLTENILRNKLSN